MKSISLLFVIAAYLMFGISGAVGPVSFGIGSNAYNLAFLNNLLPLPFILITLSFKKISLLCSKAVFGWSILLGVCTAATALLLNLSFAIIGVGTGIMLHMCHTLVAAFGEAAITRKRVKITTLFAVVAILCGIACTMDDSAAETALSGMVMALLSGITYGSMMLIMAYTSVREEPPMKVMFYSLSMGTLFLFVYTVCTEQLQLNALPATAWGIHIFCALCTNFFGFMLLQLGVRRVGATMSAIFGAIEPLTSAILGILLFGETGSTMKYFGFAFIIFGVIIQPIVNLCHDKKKRPHSSKHDSCPAIRAFPGENRPRKYIKRDPKR